MSKYKKGDIVWFIPNGDTGFTSDNLKIESMIIRAYFQNGKFEYIIQFIETCSVYPCMKVNNGYGCYANEHMLEPVSSIEATDSLRDSSATDNLVCDCGKSIKPTDDGVCYDCWNKKHIAKFFS